MRYYIDGAKLIDAVVKRQDKLDKEEKIKAISLIPGLNKRQRFVDSFVSYCAIMVAYSHHKDKEDAVGIILSFFIDKHKHIWNGIIGSDSEVMIENVWKSMVTPKIEKFDTELKTLTNNHLQLITTKKKEWKKKVKKLQTELNESTEKAVQWSQQLTETIESNTDAKKDTELEIAKIKTESINELNKVKSEIESYTVNCKRITDEHIVWVNKHREATEAEITTKLNELHATVQDKINRFTSHLDNLLRFDRIEKLEANILELIEVNEKLTALNTTNTRELEKLKQWKEKLSKD